MNKFLKKLSVLFCLFCVISLMLASISVHFKENILNYKIPNDKHIVIMGNSQTEMAINDFAIDGVINLSKSAKQYLFQRIDIENLIKCNPQIDTIFLNISPFTIRPDDADANYYDQALAKVYTYYTPYMTLSDWKHLPLRAKYFKSLISGECLRYIRNTQTPGAYVYNTRDDMGKERAKEARNKTKENVAKVNYGHAITNISLDGIGDICMKNGVKLIFIAPPLNNYSSYNLEEFRDRVFRLKNMYNADFWNYVDYKLPDSCYSDRTHLNGKGATIFSEIFQKRLGR